VTLRDRLRRIPVLLWIPLPVALAALVAWPLGGWETVTLVSRTLPQFESNQVVHTHRFDIRVDDAWLTTAKHPAGYSEPDEGEIYLVIAVEVTNTTRDTATSSDLSDYLEPVIDGEPVDGGFGVDYVLAADHTTLPEINPGLPRLMQLVWTIPTGDVAPGDDLRIDLFDGVPTKSTLFYGLRWDFEAAGYAIRTVDER
jgi:hypothetical protein